MPQRGEPTGQLGQALRLEQAFLAPAGLSLLYRRSSAVSSRSSWARCSPRMMRKPIRPPISVTTRNAHQDDRESRRRAGSTRCRATRSVQAWFRGYAAHHAEARTHRATHPLPANRGRRIRRRARLDGPLLDRRAVTRLHRGVPVPSRSALRHMRSARLKSMMTPAELHGRLFYGRQSERAARADSRRIGRSDLSGPTVHVERDLQHPVPRRIRRRCAVPDRSHLTTLWHWGPDSEHALAETARSGLRGAPSG